MSEQSSTTTDKDPLLQINFSSSEEADEVIHVALQDLYERMQQKGCIKQSVPIMEHAPPTSTDLEDKRLIIKKIVRLKQSLN